MDYFTGLRDVNGALTIDKFLNLVLCKPNSTLDTRHALLATQLPVLRFDVELSAGEC